MKEHASPAKVIASAKRLLEQGRPAEARDLLLDEGYVKRLEPAIQRAYQELIPVHPTLREVLDDLYVGLGDPAAGVRFDAATKLAREFAKVHLRGNVRWMRDPRASGPIIQAVFDADDKVARRALRALSLLVWKYFPDQRALPAFLSRLADPTQATRVDAINGIGCLRREALLEHLVPVMERGTDRDRAAVAGQIWGLALEVFDNMNQHPMEWSPVGRRFWRDRMIAALRDPYVQVRKSAARALKQLGDARAVAALRLARAEERDEDTAFYMDDAIAALE
jgi:HEAT repeat protein